MTPMSDIPWQTLTHEQIDSTLYSRIAEYEEGIAARGGKRPKREGHVVERIATMENLREADRIAQKGKLMRKIVRGSVVKKVANRHIRRHNDRAEDELRELQLMILTCEFPAPDFKAENVPCPSGKTREIMKQTFFPWKILHTAILRVIGPRIESTLIPGTCACIKKRGLHYGVRLMKKAMRLNPDMKWFWKTDFKKYYQSLPHDLVLESFSRLYKDKHFLRIVEAVYLSYDSGGEIEAILGHEREKNARCPHRRHFKPSNRQPLHVGRRPLHDVHRQGESLYPLL